MFKKAKTKRNLISILCACLSAVFAFTIGLTYAAKSLQLTYDEAPQVTSAYLGNQEYHLINDTIINPIPFGEGTHNFEIALEYAIDYNFDVRFDYKLVWSNGSDASNVVLNFANRDNIIYDENHIFLANTIEKGNGKITIINGVEFVDLTNETYYGQTLQIKINAVKIYKQEQSYVLNSHILTRTIRSSLSAQMWINYKNRTTASENYVLMYNQRRNFVNGVPYPGFETAYKKPITTTQIDQETTKTEVSGSKWLGGNKAYAGVGMYVVSGNSSLKLQVKVAAIWRENKNGSVSNVGDKNIISEDSIKLNYSDEWEHSSWDLLKMWETMTLVFEIPAQTACYIDILENVEITTASKIATNKYDAYRAVINSIIINPGLTENSANLETDFEYTEASADYIQMKTIKNNSLINEDLDDYSKKLVSVKNTSGYSNNLYSANISSASSQDFNTSVSAINNTNKTQKIILTYSLKYNISNGNIKLISDETGLRADEMINETYTSDNAFVSGLYYSYSVDATTHLIDSSSYETEIILGPYASVSLVDMYSVAASLQNAVSTKFKEAETTVYYDVWTYLDVDITSVSEVEPSETVEYYSEDDYLIFETVTGKTSITVDESTINVTTVSLRVKNNTNKVIKGITISSVAVKELKLEDFGDPIDNKPNDWDSSYWKYYTKEQDGSFTQVTSNELNNDTWSKNTYYLKSQSYETLITVESGDFVKNNSTNTFSNSTIELLPGESVEFATATAKNSNTGSVITAGFAKTSSVKNSNEFMLINKGTTNAYFVNHSTGSYYLRFVGNVSSSVSELVSTDITITVGEGEKAEQIETKNNHYIGIVRPGQIINMPMTSFYQLEIVPIENNGVFSASTLSNWNSSAINKMKALFGLS